MLKKLSLGIAVLALGAISMTAGAQQPNAQPTKTAPVAGIRDTWANGLSPTDVRMVERVVRGKGDEDRWMVYTAIVRNREASRDIYPGEPLTNDKVLANVRVRMSLDESKRWTNTWSHLTAWDRQAIIRVLRDDLSVKH